MDKLMEWARRSENKWKTLDGANSFLHHLQMGIVYIRMIEKTPLVKSDAVKTAEYLYEFFLLIRNDIKKAGEIRCWQFQRRRYSQFALDIALLAGRLKQAAGSQIIAKQ